MIYGPIWAKKPASVIKTLLETLDFNQKPINFNVTYNQDY